MNAIEFVQVYNRDEVKERAPESLTVPELDESRDWSKYFGQILYDRLADPDKSIDAPEAWQFIFKYMAWIQSDFPRLTNRLECSQSGDALILSNEANFHSLNGSMADMWRWIISPKDSTDLLFKQYVTTIAQYNVALNAFSFYRSREAMAAENQSFRYFDHESTPIRHTLEGKAAEKDTALVLLEITKQYPYMTVVPAPAQFEHQYKKRNADFIMYDQGSAIGVQVKTSVSQEDVQTYDPSRIVLLDSCIDLGSTLARRTRKNSYDTHIVSWGGLLCAQFIETIPTTEPILRILESMGHHPLEIMQWKHEARQITDGIKPNLALAIQRISERVLPRLQIL